MPGMPPLPPSAGVRWSGLAIAGFVCTFFCGVLGFILSLLGFLECNRSNGMVKGRGLALAGMILSVVFFVVGILAAVAIPAFMDYTKKSKKSEAQLQLNKIMKNSKVYFITNGAFPKYDQALTPDQSCCMQTNAKCQPASDNWNTKAWQELDFQVDEPHLYRYGYHSDGNSLTAIAVGDLDCDGIEVTYTLNLTQQNGNPMGAITEPPPNSD